MHLFLKMQYLCICENSVLTAAIMQIASFRILQHVILWNVIDVIGLETVSIISSSQMIYSYIYPVQHNRVVFKQVRKCLLTLAIGSLRQG
jgi:hypothetical protein